MARATKRIAVPSRWMSAMNENDSSRRGEHAAVATHRGVTIGSVDGASASPADVMWIVGHNRWSARSADLARAAISHLISPVPVIEVVGTDLVVLAAASEVPRR